MEKVKEGKVVQRFMTKGEIVSYGANKAGKKLMDFSYGILFLMLVLLVVAVYQKITWLGLASIGVFFIYLIAWQAWCTNVGKKFWLSIKDTLEPVNFDKAK